MSLHSASLKPTMPPFNIFSTGPDHGKRALKARPQVVRSNDTVPSSPPDPGPSCRDGRARCETAATSVIPAHATQANSVNFCFLAISQSTYPAHQVSRENTIYGGWTDILSSHRFYEANTRTALQPRPAVVVEDAASSRTQESPVSSPHPVAPRAGAKRDKQTSVLHLGEESEMRSRVPSPSLPYSQRVDVKYGLYGDGGPGFQVSRRWRTLTLECARPWETALGSDSRRKCRGLDIGASAASRLVATNFLPLPLFGQQIPDPATNGQWWLFLASASDQRSPDWASLNMGAPRRRYVVTTESLASYDTPESAIRYGWVR